MTTSTRQSLSVDLEELFPGDTVTVGTQVLVIRPLGLEQITMLVKQLKGLIPIIQEAGITSDNFNEPDNIFLLVTIILDNAPGILEEASNIILDDIKRLPFEVIVQIVDKVITVNMHSKDILEKNFKSLITKFLQMGAEKAPKKVEK